MKASRSGFERRTKSRHIIKVMSNEDEFLESFSAFKVYQMERARRFERPTLTLARLCSTPELRPRYHSVRALLGQA